MNSPRSPDKLLSSENFAKLWQATIQEAVRATYHEHMVLKACRLGKVDLSDLVAARTRKEAAHALLRVAARELNRRRQQNTP